MSTAPSAMRVTSPSAADVKASSSTQASAQRQAVHHDETQYTGEEDGDEVFSNPDTAELEWRSDATGATSPTPNSPGPGPSSPSNRLSSNVAVVAGSGNGVALARGSNSILHHSTPSDALGTMSMDLGQKPLILSQLPTPPGAASTQTPLDYVSRDDTPRLQAGQVASSSPRGTTQGDESIDSARRAKSGRPSFLRTKSASGAAVAGMGSPSIGSNSSMLGQSYNPGTSRLGGHASSLSTSHATPRPNQLPSAHGLPADPREAMSLSTLFAHAPMHSPGEEQPGFSFSPVRHRSLNASPCIPQHDASFASERQKAQSVKSVASPERLLAPHGRGDAGSATTSLRQSPRMLATQGERMSGAELSIFERDIEHRNVGHVLSKQEAVDVAIPSVLDDAIEALANNEFNVEIVTPHAAAPLHPLSAQALTAHSRNQSHAALSTVSVSGTPALSPSPPMSSAGCGAAATEPPPGTMAAQIAERFGQPRSTAHSDVFGASTSSSRHRRPKSDASASSSSSVRSRSVQQPIASVQNVLATSSSPSGARSTSHSPPAANKGSTSPAAAEAAHSHSRSVASRPGITVQPSNSTLTPVKMSGLPASSTLPTLPLPNPFRSPAPVSNTTQQVGDAESGGFPMQSSVSMDGAVMPSSESATFDASLDGLADAVTSRLSMSSASAAHSPVSRLRSLPVYDDNHGSAVEAGPYSSRSPARSAMPSASHSPVIAPSEYASVPRESLSSARPDAKTSGIAVGSANKKRLSFFSYADILNETPADVMRIDDALGHVEQGGPAGSSAH